MALQISTTELILKYLQVVASLLSLLASWNTQIGLLGEGDVIRPPPFTQWSPRRNRETGSYERSEMNGRITKSIK